MKKGDFVCRNSIGGKVVAVVMETKRIGTMQYARVIDEHGMSALLPCAALEAKGSASTVGENKRELAALGFAISSSAQQ